MFFGEFLCVIPFIFMVCNKKPIVKNVSINDVPAVAQLQQSYFHYIFAFPTLCDLTSTTLSNIGILWIPASIWQMMRGAIIIFSGILSIFVFKRKLQFHHWLGMGIVVSGLVMVGASGIINNSNSNSSPILVALGIIFVLSAQLISATQMVVQEIFLKKRNYHPLNLVFMEGFWGLTFMYFLVLPLTNLTPQPPVQVPGLNHTVNAFAQVYHENFIDAIIQMQNKPLFIILECFILTSIAFYNFFGLSVTRKLTAVHRTLIDACRTIFVWSIQVILYKIDPILFENVGERLTWFSLLQAGGFVCLIIGTLTYNAVIKCPCSNYEKK